MAVRRRSKKSKPFDYNVFINCPYDRPYEALFDAMVFAIYDCGFLPRAALEVEDATTDRVEKIIGLIRRCKYAISDLSRIEVDPRTKLPRFNMAFELGLILGIAASVPRGRRPVTLILEKRKGQYQKFVSDLAGREAKPHGNKAKTAVARVRNWLRSGPAGELIPGGDHIWKRYREFQKELPRICRELRLTPKKLTFHDYTVVVEEWLSQHPF